MKIIHITLAFCLFFVIKLAAQKIAPPVLQQTWDAHWIKVPGQQDLEFGVYHFRKSFNLTTQPSEFIIHVSADNRYKLYVNGEFVGLGPSRGDLFHWNFETLDISSYLKPGDNVIAAVVWQFGKERPMAQMTFSTGFILQGNSQKEAVLNTDQTWKCYRNNAYAIQKPQMTYTYYVAGPQEEVSYSQYPANWEMKGFDDSAWPSAQKTSKGLPKYGADWTEALLLVPREIPAMEREEISYKKMRYGKGMNVQEDFPYEWARLDVPANSKVEILIDQEELVNAYPAFEFSGGKSSSISLQYAESFFIDEKSGDWRAEQRKPNRNSVGEGFRLVGPKDKIWCDGGKGRTWESLWYRTFRYVKLEIETKDEPLVITNFRAIQTGYPFKMNAKLESGNPEIDKMMAIGWRTARLCATETYMDCPYYEQLQYVGDSRIQALISYFNSGDDRLARNAIKQFDQSRLAEGITQSRFPSYVPQQIPPFSLWWIGMVHDFYKYRNDNEFVKSMLPGSREILRWFFKLQKPDGTLNKVPYWNFTDWSEDPDWQAGRAPYTAKGESSALDFQLLWALQNALELEQRFGSPERVAEYSKKIALLQKSVKAIYWDKQKGIFSDTPEFKHYSQHPNALAVLTGTVTGEEAKKLMRNILKDKSLMPCSVYFKYYLHQAANKAGVVDDYMVLLDEWRQQMDNGLTTWAEQFEPSKTRSDCHAWSAHPNIEFFRIMLGIDASAPNFSKVRIQPRLGTLAKASGSIPHPKGEVSVDYLKDKTGLRAKIKLPPGVSGEFAFAGKIYPLKPGENNLTAK